MFYLSEIAGKPVYDLQGNPVARIRDVVAKLSEDPQPAEEANAEEPVVIVENDDEVEELDVPLVKGLLTRTGRNSQPFFLDIHQVASIGPEGARLKSAQVDLKPFERRAGEMVLSRDLWDKQVIDLETRKVVRVNDIAIRKTQRGWRVPGVDVGFGGLVRRLGLANIVRRIAHKAAEPRLVHWQNLDVFGSNVPGGVTLLHKKLAKLHPVEIAHITDSVSYLQGAEIIASLDDTLAADTLEEILPERQTDIMEHIPNGRAADILEEMAPDEATDLLSELPEDKAGALLEEMDEQDAQEVRYLMRYPEHSAGGIMTTDMARALPNMTVAEVIDANRATFLSADLIYYIYVVDSEESNHLAGIITVRDLLVHERDEVVGDFMLKEFLSARPGEKEQFVARKMAEYNLLALPVLDRDGVLLGIVTVDDALDVVLPHDWRKRLPKIFN